MQLNLIAEQSIWNGTRKEKEEWKIKRWMGLTRRHYIRSCRHIDVRECAHCTHIRLWRRNFWVCHTFAVSARSVCRCLDNFQRNRIRTRAFERWTCRWPFRDSSAPDYSWPGLAQRSPVSAASSSSVCSHIDDRPHDSHDRPFAPNSKRTRIRDRRSLVAPSSTGREDRIPRHDCTGPWSKCRWVRRRCTRDDKRNEIGRPTVGWSAAICRAAAAASDRPPKAAPCDFRVTLHSRHVRHKCSSRHSPICLLHARYRDIIKNFEFLNICRKKFPPWFRERMLMRMR